MASYTCLLIIYEKNFTSSLHKQITNTLTHSNIVCKKYIYHSSIFKNFIKIRFPQNPITHIFFIFKQALKIYIRHTYFVWVSPTNWGCKLQVHVKCSWNAKWKWRTIWFSAKCTKFISRILNKWPVGIRQWIYILYVYFILLIYIVDFGTWKYLHYSMLRVKMNPILICTIRTIRGILISVEDRSPARISVY